MVGLMAVELGWAPAIDPPPARDGVSNCMPNRRNIEDPNAGSGLALRLILASRAGSGAYFLVSAPSSPCSHFCHNHELLRPSKYDWKDKSSGPPKRGTDEQASLTGASTRRGSLIFSLRHPGLGRRSEESSCVSMAD